MRHSISLLRSNSLVPYIDFFKLSAMIRPQTTCTDRYWAQKVAKKCLTKLNDNTTHIAVVTSSSPYITITYYFDNKTVRYLNCHMKKYLNRPIVSFVMICAHCRIGVVDYCVGENSVGSRMRQCISRMSGTV